MELLKLTDVSVGYEGKPVASHLSLTLNEGDYLCIVGENGAGKSTLMKTLLNLRAPIEGSIVFSDAIARNEIGYLPQQTQVQRDFPATVWEVVLSGCLNRSGLRPFYTKAQKQTAEDWIARLDITDLKKRSYRALSGGQQQRVLLARALCATTTLLVLDEPVSGLDPLATADFYKLIRRINRDYGITVIMVSHDLQDALSLATHILHMKQSGAFFGTKQEYLQSDVYRAFTGGDNHA